MVASSVGSITNSNIPPSNPVIFTIPPSHVAVNSNEESSGSNVVISTVVVVGHKYVSFSEKNLPKYHQINYY